MKKYIPIFIIFGISFVLILLYISVAVPSFSMWFYRWQFEANSTYERVQMQPDQLHLVTRHLIDYMRGSGVDRDYGLQIYAIVAGISRPFFSEIEIRHMLDVYDLFMYGRIIRNVSIVLFFVSFLILLVDRKFIWHLIKSLQIASAGVLSLLVALISLVAINWHAAFVLFHEIFFDNDYWILNPRYDLLLNIVPYDFFITISVVIGAMFGFFLLATFVASTFYLRKKGLKS